MATSYVRLCRTSWAVLTPGRFPVPKPSGGNGGGRLTVGFVDVAVLAVPVRTAAEGPDVGEERQLGDNADRDPDRTGQERRHERLDKARDEQDRGQTDRHADGGPPGLG